MDKKEAQSILAERLARYRTRSYVELASWVRDGRIDTSQVAAPNGHLYEIEVQFFWDDKPDADIRVFASISDRGIRALVPFTPSFIMNPAGRFVGE